MADDKDLYPEHTKLKLIKDQSQNIGDFLGWLDENEVYLAKYTRPDDNWLTRLSASRNDLLAEYFEIDQQKLEEEKLHMLAYQRALNETKQVKG